MTPPPPPHPCYDDCPFSTNNLLEVLPKVLNSELSNANMKIVKQPKTATPQMFAFTAKKPKMFALVFTGTCTYHQ